MKKIRKSFGEKLEDAQNECANIESICAVVMAQMWDRVDRGRLRRIVGDELYEKIKEAMRRRDETTKRLLLTLRKEI